MALVKINASGTSKAAFSIGKKGTTIFQGSTNPSDSNGATGDLYIKTGAAPRLFQKLASGWMVPASDFVREEVSSGQTLTVAAITTYVALRAAISADSTQITADTTHVTVDSGASGNATIVLPAGYEGQIITIKDEAGVAASHAFTVRPASGLIDGAASKTFSTAFVTVKVLYTGGAWWLISTT